MSTIIKDLVVSDVEPRALNAMWIKPTANSFEIKLYRNGQWVKDDTDNLEVSDITTIPGSVIDILKPGDLIIKITGTHKHRYHVSYKGATGICLTYVDAENVETVAYEKGESGWGYLDTTITNIGGSALLGTPSDTSDMMTLYGLKAYIDEHI